MTRILIVVQKKLLTSQNSFNLLPGILFHNGTQNLFKKLGFTRTAQKSHQRNEINVQSSPSVKIIQFSRNGFQYSYTDDISISRTYLQCVV